MTMATNFGNHMPASKSLLRLQKIKFGMFSAAGGSKLITVNQGFSIFVSSQSSLDLRENHK